MWIRNGPHIFNVFVFLLCILIRGKCKISSHPQPYTKTLQKLLHGWVGYFLGACACQADMAGRIINGSLSAMKWDRNKQMVTWHKPTFAAWTPRTKLSLGPDPLPFPKTKLWGLSVEYLGRARSVNSLEVEVYTVFFLSFLFIYLFFY